MQDQVGAKQPDKNALPYPLRKYWLLRPYDHREIPVPAGLAKHPSAAGARGQTERVIPNTLRGPTGIPRNQEIMQDQVGAKQPDKNALPSPIQ